MDTLSILIVVLAIFVANATLAALVLPPIRRLEKKLDDPYAGLDKKLDDPRHATRRD